MRLFIDVTVTQATLFARRLAFVIYVVLMLVLAGAVIFTDSLSGGTGALVVRVSNNLLFFQLPLLALLISPLIVQHKGPRKDWLWTTSLELPLLVLSQFVGVVLVLCVTLALIGFLALALLVIVGTVPIGNVVSLYGYYLLLLLPVTLAAAGVVIALALLARNTYVVTATVASISALTWLGLLMPTATLLTPLNFTLLTLDLNPVVGLGAERPLLLALLLFYLGCIPLMLILATAAHTRLDRRTGWSPKRQRSFSGLALLALIAAGGSWQFYAVTVAQRLVPAPVAEQIDVWEVVNAEQSATLEERTLQIGTRMRLRNRSGEAQGVVELGLNPGLRVTSASAAGETVSSQRIGELIRLGPLPAAVAAGGEIEFELLYTGVPILLREDYQLASDVTGDDPVSFQQAYVSFADGHALQWMRDSDWLAWPRTPGPHVAREIHSLQIALNNSDGPFLSSGAISEQTGDETVYVWENPPQFLVAGGAYRHSSSGEGDIWIGKLSTEQTTASARKLLRLRRALGEWLEASPHDAYIVVELPYIPHQRLALGGLILGFPNRIDRPSGWNPVSVLDFALLVSRAWLSNQIQWPENRLSQAGVLRGFMVTCGPPDGNMDNREQEWECTRESLGGVNPQAPHGRWIEEPESQSEVTPLQHAFAVVTAQELAFSLPGDRAYIDQEQSKWESMLSYYQEGRFSADPLSPPSISPENRPVGAFSTRNNCLLAHFIVALNGFASQFGRDALADLIAALAQAHPPGGDPLTEEVVRRILHDRFGYDLPPSGLSCKPTQARTPAQ